MTLSFECTTLGRGFGLLRVAGDPSPAAGNTKKPSRLIASVWETSSAPLPRLQTMAFLFSAPTSASCCC
jgi:hypothetical protein